MPAGILSEIQQKGLLVMRGFLVNDGVGSWLIKEKSECSGSRNFFLAGEKGER